MKRIDFDKMTKIIKSRNFFIAVCVFVLTIASLGVSYASFFTVKTNTNNQTVQTGTLAVSYGNSSSSILRDSMSSMSDEAGMSQGESSLVYIQNTGSLNSTFTLNIGYDMENFTKRSGYSANDKLTPLDYIMLAVYEYKGVGVNDELIVGPISIADLPIYRMDENDYRYNRYSVLFNTVGSNQSTNSTKTYKIKMWLSDKAIPAASYSYFYVNSEIVAEVENAKMQYNFSGKVTNTSGGGLSDATINLHNGSVIVKTDSNGNYTLNGLYPGIYNVDIIYNNQKFSGNLTVSEGSSNSLVSLGESFAGMDIYTVASKYGTTLSKIISKNNVNTYSTAASLQESKSYSLSPTYKFTGGSDENISGVNFVLDESNNTYAMSLS